MAMSLEDLLAEEGFKGSSSKRMTRASSGPSTRKISSYPPRDEHKFGAATRLKKTERAYSDTRRYDMRVESPITDRVKSRRSLDILKREKLDRGARNEPKERHNRRGSQDMRDVTGYSINSSQQISADEIVEVKEGIQRVKDGILDKGRYKDIYLNGVFSPPISKNKQYSRAGEDERYENISGKDVQIDDGYANDYDKHLSGSRDNYQKDGNQPGSSSSKSNKSTHNKENVRDSRVRKPVEIESVAEVALDDIAIKAMISILSGYIKSFLKDQDFRTSMYHNCFAALNYSKLEEEIVAESKIISNLDQAIETVEQAAEKHATAKELKKASLQLSVITGLNANDLKDGFTSGIPNSILSACGHLYLSVIYQLQKKERIAAKHILQIFCDSPSAARTTLVPELWETVFHPHLSHLEVWYNQEVDSLADDPHNTRKLKQLKKVYYEILDSGTYQFALYYKDWLTDGVEAPSIPSINVPSVSVQGNQHEIVSGHSSEFGSPSFSSQPMVSKKLYDSVFRRVHKPTTAESEDYQYSQRSDDDKYSFDGSVVEDKRTLTYSLEEDEYDDLGVKRDMKPYQDGIIAQEELLKLEDLGSINMLQSLPVSEVNELTIKRLAKFVFGLHQTERSVDVIETNRLSHSDDAIYPDLLPIVTRPLGEVHPGNYANGGGHFFLNIPQDYVCPLTRLIFEDPVTLETGQTYERSAIIEWLNKGNKTCPVTGKTLECHIMPFTNSVLKRVIDGWKSKHSREILASASQPAGSPGEQKYKAEAAVFILEQLLTVFGTEENTANAKLLIALGGLQFLIQRFAYGNLDERSRVAALLSHCIKADSGCRNHVARNIEKQGLLELLHCKGITSRSNAVFLLFDLICLNRRKDARFFLNGLHKEGIVSSMHILLLFLQSCSPEQRPLVAVLLLQLDLMADVDQQKYSIYREEAVDTISSALDTSLSNEKVRETCCRALLILGGHISSSGKVVTVDRILKNAGFFDRLESDALDDKITTKDNILLDNDEEEAVEDWLMKLSASLLSDGKKSFLDSLSQCLSSGHQDMTKAGLTTVAWFSSSFASLPELSSVSVLISKLKENLINSECVEHKILAATSLLNFSKIPAYEGKCDRGVVGSRLWVPLPFPVLNFSKIPAYEGKCDRGVVGSRLWVPLPFPVLNFSKIPAYEGKCDRGVVGSRLWVPLPFPVLNFSKIPAYEGKCDRGVVGSRLWVPLPFPVLNFSKIPAYEGKCDRGVVGSRLWVPLPFPVLNFSKIPAYEGKCDRGVVGSRLWVPLPFPVLNFSKIPAYEGKCDRGVVGSRLWVPLPFPVLNFSKIPAYEGKCDRGVVGSRLWVPLPFPVLNFSKIPDCTNLLMRMADEIASPLRNLSEASWMAQELHAFISREDL